MPGFLPADEEVRTEKQKMNLKDAVFSADWRQTNNPEVVDREQRVLKLCEVGGWNFLSFLEKLQRPLGRQTEQLYESFNGSGDLKIDMVSTRQASICLARMSWAAFKIEDLGEGDEDMRARVSESLEILRSQPSKVQSLILWTLDTLVWSLSKRLQLARKVRKWAKKYGATREQNPAATMKNDEELCKAISKILCSTILQFCFWHGISDSFRLCAPAKTEGKLLAPQRELRDAFFGSLRELLKADRAGVAMEETPVLEEGMLWAAGMEVASEGFLGLNPDLLEERGYERRTLLDTSMSSKDI